MLAHYQQYVVVSFFLFLPSIVGAAEQPISGHEVAAVEKRADEELEGNLRRIWRNSDDRLLIIGAIQMNTSAWSRKDCVLDIIVEIGDKTWKQQLNSNSFAFQVPVRSFGGMPGMFSIHNHGGKRLWNHFFVVQDIGVQHLNATLSGDCTRILNPGSSLIRWIPALCPSLGVMEKTDSLGLSTMLSTGVPLMCPVPFRRNVEHFCLITGALEIYPTSTYERKAYFGMDFLEIFVICINDRLRDFAEISDWHPVFGVYFLQTWHFHCLGIVFLFLHIVNWFFRILLSQKAIALSNLEIQVTVDECPRILLIDREPETLSCPSSGTSLSGPSRQDCIQSRQGSAVPLSSDILHHDSWGDAHQFLRKLIDFPEDGSGYRYNCTTHRRSFSDLLLLHPGRWSRDSNGRLIRDRP